MVVGSVIAALLAVPMQTAEPAATIAAPARTVTVSNETLAHWTPLAGGQGQALKILIEAAWAEGEALERGITVTAAEAQSEAEPDERRSRADELFVARVELLTARIRDQITQPAAQSVTPEQIEAYVMANPRLDPEERRIRVVAARSRTHAKRALAKLANGLTWSSAVRRYGSGAVQRTVRARANVRGWQRAVLRAEPGELTRYGTHVFKVTKVTQARPAPPDVQRAQAWEILSSEAQRQALAAFDEAFKAKWRARTTCAQPHESCGNPPTGE